MNPIITSAENGQVGRFVGGAERRRQCEEYHHTGEASNSENTANAHAAPIPPFLLSRLCPYYRRPLRPALYMSETQISTYEQERRQKRDKLRELGLDPYGQAAQGITPLADIRAQYKPEMGHDSGPVVKGAGRVMLKRDMGKLSFLTIRDETGDLQVALDKKRLSETAWEVNGLIDLGDLILVEGPLGVTKKGEITIWATQVTMSAKALLSPPTKELKDDAGNITKSGFSDIEARYRQRYVDLWANPEVMRTMKLRMQIVDEIRQYMRGRGFLEVETPMMQPLHGGAAARPFKTHHNALDIELFMRIAPELYLKRLLVGGFTKVFELNRNFRNEGISPRHNPEFTMLEAYEAFGSWETMADLVEGMICHIAEKLFGGLKIRHKGTPTVEHVETESPVHHGAMPHVRTDRETEGTGERVIDLTRPWRRVTMAELVEERTGWAFDKASIESHGDVLAKVLAAYDPDGADALARRDAGLELFSAQERSAERLTAFRSHLLALSPAEQLVEVYEKLIEHTLVNPTFVTQVPSVIIPLAKKNPADPFFADVYELAINGQEISPGYTELNDPDVQAANFGTQVGDKEEQQKVDEDFLNALRYGMPPAGGMGMGIDRLVMMLTGAESIRDVVLFPLMRPT
jgi:lysyl-tRNA synthetase class 2